jgi:hypothetical protein
VVENDAGMTSSRGELTKADTSYSDNPAAPGKPPAAASGFKENTHINSLVVSGSEVLDIHASFDNNE